MWFQGLGSTAVHLVSVLLACQNFRVPRNASLRRRCENGLWSHLSPCDDPSPARSLAPSLFPPMFDWCRPGGAGVMQVSVTSSTTSAETAAVLQATSAQPSSWSASQTVNITVEYYHCDAGEYWVANESVCDICTEASDIGEEEVSSRESCGRWRRLVFGSSLGCLSVAAGCATRLAPSPLAHQLLLSLLLRHPPDARFRRRTGGRLLLVLR